MDLNKQTTPKNKTKLEPCKQSTIILSFDKYIVGENVAYKERFSVCIVKDLCN